MDRIGICIAVVFKFGEHRRCRVEWHGEELDEYTPMQTYWVERCEDEYGIAQMKGTFCVLRRDEWIKGEPEFRTIVN